MVLASRIDVLNSVAQFAFSHWQVGIDGSLEYIQCFHVECDGSIKFIDVRAKVKHRFHTVSMSLGVFLFTMQTLRSKHQHFCCD